MAVTDKDYEAFVEKYKPKLSMEAAPQTPAAETAPTDTAPEDDSIVDRYKPKVSMDRPFTRTVTPPSVVAPTAAEDESVVPVNTSPEKAAGMSLGPSDILNDPERMATVRDHMKRRFGVGMSAWTGEVYNYDDKQSDEEVLDMFLTNSRKFNDGQSVTVLNDAAWLATASDEDRIAWQKAADVYDELGGVFSENYTWGEMFSGIGTHIRAAIVDPVNLVSLGVGKAATKASAKGVSLAAKKLATQSAEMVVAKATAKKVLGKAATKELREVAYRAGLEVAMKKLATKAPVKAIAEKAAKAGVIAGVATDVVTSQGVEAVRQRAEIYAGRQASYEATGFLTTAAGQVLGLGASAAVLKMIPAVKRAPNLIAAQYQAGDTIEANAKAAASTLNAQNVAIDLDFNLKSLMDNPPKHFKWAEKVKAGKTVMGKKGFTESTMEVDFMQHLLLGNKEAGVKGLVQSMADAGLRRVGTRWHEDNVTNYLLDTLKYLPKEYKDKMEDSFRANVSSKIPALKDMTLDEFVNRAATRTSDAGRLLNLSSQASRILRDNASTKDIVEELDKEVIPLSFVDHVKGTGGYITNRLIKAIVTHPATTMANVKGYVGYTAMETGKDLIKATLYGGWGGIKAVVGGSSADSFSAAIGVLKSQRTKFRNILSPEATYEEFASYAASRKQVMDSLLDTLNGVPAHRSVEDQLAEFGFDPAANKVSAGIDKTLDFFSTWYGAKAADSWMKSQSFMFHLDQKLLTKYNMSYSDLLKKFDKDNEGLVTFMGHPDYMKLEAEAVEETLRSTFSKSYANHGSLDFGRKPIESLAAIVEKISKFPIFGVQIPFGRFFNNTVAFMADYSGASVFHKAISKTNPRDYTELLARTAAGWGAVYSLAQIEMDAIDEGLDTYQMRQADGSILDVKADYPLSVVKAAARALAYHWKGGIPPGYMAEVSKDFGTSQLTRNLKDPETWATAVAQTFFEEGGLAAITKMGGGLMDTYVSGSTRFLDPLNQLAAIAQGEEYQAPDRKQGPEALNKSLRYVDNTYNFIASFLAGEEVDLMKPKRDIMRQGDIGMTATAVIGWREAQPVTYAQKLFVAVGKPGYTGMPKSADAAANSAIASRTAYFLEQAAKAELNSPEFHKLKDPAAKLARVNAVLESAKQKAKDSLSGSFDPKDRAAALVFEISGKTKMDEIALKEALKAFGFDAMELGDLSEAHLELIQEWIKSYKSTITKGIE